MILKNEDHGVMRSPALSDIQKKNGWVEITEAELLEIATGKAPAEETSATPPGVDFDDMTKREVEVYARDFNDKEGNPIELDRRMSKKNMLQAFNEQLGD